MGEALLRCSWDEPDWTRGARAIMFAAAVARAIRKRLSVPLPKLFVRDLPPVAGFR
jgi:hypothetical protein